MLKTILVALDVEPDPLADQVMQTLGQLRLESSTIVILAHVIVATQTEVEVVVDRPEAGLESFPHDRIEKQLHRYQETLPCQSQVEVVTGEPVEEILRLAHI
ncbi:MAG: universal stress protein, partial [Phormidesmis sp. CAN_BIN36]|nr:universal stress protein [Phormidesmis sp. CAN_BIN36]